MPENDQKASRKKEGSEVATILYIINTSLEMESEWEVVNHLHKLVQKVRPRRAVRTPARYPPKQLSTGTYL
jgi:hypothetical protein